MKLKYYMRGLGIGIILTTFLFVISGYEKKLTKEEIIELAKEYGMVEAGEQKDPLEQVLGEIIPTKEPAPTLEPTPEPTAEPTVEPTAEPTPEPTAKPTVEPTAEPTPEPTAKPTVEPTNSPTEKPKKETSVTFTITKGMTSDSVSDLLYKAGLVDSAKKFNDYIIRAGKSTVIRTGKYTVKKGATYDEIIDIITK